MATIMVTGTKRTETGIYFEMVCEKTSMVVGVVGGAHPYVTTLVQNGSHKAWGGMGKTFYGPSRFDDARAAYKSAACKAMIDHAIAETEKAATANDNAAA